MWHRSGLWSAPARGVALATGSQDGHAGYTDEELCEEGVLCAGMHFVQKPATRDDLAFKVREVLEG